MFEKIFSWTVHVCGALLKLLKCQLRLQQKTNLTIMPFGIFIDIARDSKVIKPYFFLKKKLKMSSAANYR